MKKNNKMQDHYGLSAGLFFGFVNYISTNLLKNAFGFLFIILRILCSFSKSEGSFAFTSLSDLIISNVVYW